jgi:hypothetical protein
MVVVDWTRKKKRQRNRKVELAVQKAEWLRTAGNAMEGGMATRMVVCSLGSVYVYIGEWKG